MYRPIRNSKKAPNRTVRTPGRRDTTVAGTANRSLKMSATAQPSFDVRDPAFLADPYPVFRQLRANAPVWKSPFGRWFLTGYEDTVLLLRDRRFGKGYDDPE